MEGRLQSFYGVVKGLGDSRPLWKVLRVLGNVFALQGFEYDSSEQVLKDAVNADTLPEKLNNQAAWQSADVQTASGLVRVGGVGIYHSDAIARRWLHMVTANSNVRMVITLTPYSYWLSATYPTHGSPHDSDANVPVLFWGAGVKPGQYSDIVRVVDIAPTLAAILGVKPMELLDGRVLTPVVR